MRVRLVAGVPDDGVARGVEHPVQCQGQLHHAEVRTEVSAVYGHDVHDARPDLCCQLRELGLRQCPEVGGLVNFV